MKIKKMVYLGYCPTCGNEVEADFCDHCGAFTQEPPEDDCRTTHTNAQKDTPGMKYGKVKGRKPRKNRVQRADKRGEK